MAQILSLCPNMFYIHLKVKTLTVKMHMGYYWLSELLKEIQVEQTQESIRQHFLFVLKSLR